MMTRGWRFDLLMSTAAAARGTLQKADLHQIRLHNVFDRHGFLANGRRQRFHTHGAAVIILDNRVQHASVAGIEPKLVNLEAVKRNLRRAVCDDAVAHDLRKVAHAL